MAGVFTINGAQGKDADTKPLVYINDELLKTNLTNGNYTFENLGYGKKEVINLKEGGVITFITYTDQQSEISIPMSSDMYTVGYCTELAKGGPFTLKIIDNYLGVCAQVTTCTADFVSGVSIDSGSDMRLVLKGSPVEFLLI